MGLLYLMPRPKREEGSRTKDKVILKLEIEPRVPHYNLRYPFIHRLTPPSHLKVYDVIKIAGDYQMHVSAV